MLLYVTMESIINNCPENGNCNYCVRYSSFIQRSDADPILRSKLDSIKRTVLDYHARVVEKKFKRNFKPLLIDIPWLNKNFGGDISKLFKNLGSLSESITPNNTNEIDIGTKDKRIREIYTDTINSKNLKIVSGGIYFENNYKLCIINKKIVLRALSTKKVPKMIGDLLRPDIGVGMEWDTDTIGFTEEAALVKTPQLTEREWEGIYLDLLFSDDNLDVIDTLPSFKLVDEDFEEVSMDILFEHKNYTFKDIGVVKYKPWYITQTTGESTGESTGKSTVESTVESTGDTTTNIIELSTTYKSKQIYGVINGDHKILHKGEGFVYVTNSNGPVNNGDYITTSVIPGIGCKQDSEYLCNYTVGKSISNIDFTQECVFMDDNGVVLDADLGTELGDIDLHILAEINNVEFTNSTDVLGILRSRYTHRVKKIACIYCC